MEEKNTSVIYIVKECVPYECCSIVKVTDSKELADSMAARVNQLMQSSSSDLYYTVEKHEIDNSEPEFMKHSKSLFCCEFFPKYELWSQYLQLDDFNDTPEIGKRKECLDRGEHSYVDCFVWANSKEEAEEMIDEDMKKNPIKFKENQQ